MLSLICRIRNHNWHLCTCLRCGAHQHDWNGCTCSRCMARRDEEHDWDGCTCSRCMARRDEEHDWDGCTCSRCNTNRDVNHNWDWSKCKCIRCNIEQHDWEFIIRTNVIQKCKRCGREQPLGNYEKARMRKRIEDEIISSREYRNARSGYRGDLIIMISNEDIEDAYRYLATHGDFKVSVHLGVESQYSPHDRLQMDSDFQRDVSASIGPPS